MEETVEKDYYKRVLTGNYYYKATILGLVICVEVEHHFVPNTCARKDFEKASLIDLFALGLITSPASVIPA